MSFDVALKKRLGAFALETVFATGSGLTAVHGPSGSGKTSLLNMVAGVLKPDEGHVHVAGATLFDSAAGISLPPEARGSGYIFQDGRLFPHLSVRRNLLYGAALAGEGAGPLSFAETVRFLGIEPLLDRPPRALSGGEAQRVAIGRALLARPRFLLMDEPLASLDAARREEIFPILERLRDEVGLPILYVSHDLPEIERIADHLVLMAAEGRVVAAGPLPRLLVDLALPFASAPAAASVVSVKVAAYDARYGMTETQLGGHRFFVVGRLGPEGARRRVRIRATDVSLALHPPEETSAANALAARILAASPCGAHQMTALLTLELGNADARLLARLTRRSWEALRLAEGSEVYAVVKAVAVAAGGETTG